MNMANFKKYRELIVGIVVGIFTIAYLVGSIYIRRTDFVAIGAEFMPELYGGFLLLLSLAQIIIGVRIVKRHNAIEKSTNEKGEEQKDNKNVAKTFILIIVYVAVMNFIGFIISSVVFLFLLSIILTPANNKKRYINYAIFSVVMPIICFYLFNNVMNLALPTGVLGI